jgi:TonB family protein
MMKSRLFSIAALAALFFSQVPRADARPRAGVSRQPAAQSSSQTPAPAGVEAWERYTFPGEEFSVELPGTPFDFESGRVVSYKETETMRTFGLYSDGVVYVVTSYDNPRRSESFERFAGYHWGGRGIKFVRELKLGGFEGREYQSSGAFNSRSRVFRAKRHAYLVCAMTYGAADDPRAARFLDSFALGPKPSGRAIYEPPPPPLIIPPKPEGGEGAPPPMRAQVGPYTHKEVSRRAVIVFKPEPSYTEDARRNGVSGAIRIRAVLAGDGAVRNVSVVTQLPYGLTEKAVNAARHLLFFPAEKDGVKVSQYVTLEYNFNIY